MRRLRLLAAAVAAGAVLVGVGSTRSAGTDELPSLLWPLPTVGPLPTLEPLPTLAPLPTLEPLPTSEPLPTLALPTLALPTVEPLPTLALPPLLTLAPIATPSPGGSSPAFTVAVSQSPGSTPNGGTAAPTAGATPDGGSGASSAGDTAAPGSAGSGGPFDGSVLPLLAVGVPALVALAILVTQLLGGAAMLPLVRRTLGSLGLNRWAGRATPVSDSAPPERPA